LEPNLKFRRRRDKFLLIVTRVTAKTSLRQSTGAGGA